MALLMKSLCIALACKMGIWFSANFYIFVATIRPLRHISFAKVYVVLNSLFVNLFHLIMKCNFKIQVHCGQNLHGTSSHSKQGWCTYINIDYIENIYLSWVTFFKINHLIRKLHLQIYTNFVCLTSKIIFQKAVCCKTCQILWVLPKIYGINISKIWSSYH